jgi:hypothetical protein
MKKIKFVRHTLIALMGLTPFAIIPAITTSCTPTEIGNFDLSKILDSEIPTEHIQIFAVDPTHVTINEEQAIEVDHTLRSDIQALIAKHLPNVTPKDYTINSLPVPSEDMTKEVPIEMSIIATRTGALSGAKYFTVYVKADNTARFNIGACQGDIPQQTVYVTYKKDPSKVPSSVIKNVIDHHNGIKNLIIDSISKISGKKTITDKDFTFSVQVPDIGDYTKHPVYPIEVTAIDKNPSGLTGNFTIDCIIAIYAEDAKDLSSYEINPTDFIMHSLTPHTVTGADFDSFINYYKTLAYESISEKSGISIEDLKKDNLQFSDGHIDGGNYSSPLKVIINVKA